MDFGDWAQLFHQGGNLRARAGEHLDGHRRDSSRRQSAWHGGLAPDAITRFAFRDDTGAKPCRPRAILFVMCVRLRICYITDRKSLPGRSLEAFAPEVIAAGVDLIQIREKDLETRALLNLALNLVAASQGHASRVVINDRLDVALAAGAAGVHLGRLSLPAQQVRRIVPQDFQVGASCHSVTEVRAAEEAGANYVLLGPIFETPSKLGYGPPLGLESLRRAASMVSIPILALGGITVERAWQCREAGAAGFAGIRIFQEAPSVARRVQELRQNWGEP